MCASRMIEIDQSSSGPTRQACHSAHTLARARTRKRVRTHGNARARTRKRAYTHEYRAYDTSDLPLRSATRKKTRQVIEQSRTCPCTALGKAVGRRRCPNAKVSLEVANTTAIAHQVRNYLLDIGLIEGAWNEPELDVIHWRRDELVVFCSAEHPLAEHGDLTDQDLVSVPWILRETGSGTRQTFERAMHGILPKLNIALELQHTEAIKRAVEANLGIGCLSKITLVEAFKRGNLVPLNVPHRHFNRDLSFILHKKKYRSAGLNNWLALCQRPEFH